MEYGYEKLNVWKEAFELAFAVHELTKQFPKEDRYTYAAQMRRAALSIPSNIAEGKGRLNDNELRRFCLIAYGSAMELYTQFLFVKKLRYAPEQTPTNIEKQIQSVLRLLNAFINRIRKPAANREPPAADRR